MLLTDRQTHTEVGVSHTVLGLSWLAEATAEVTEAAAAAA